MPKLMGLAPDCKKGKAIRIYESPELRLPQF